MNKKELTSLVRRIVREEVEKEVQRNIGLIEARITRSFRKTLEEVLTESVVSEGKKIPKKKKTKAKKLNSPVQENNMEWNTGNSKLDKILLETKDTIPPETDGPGVMIDANRPSIAEDPTVPEDLKEVFTRNYSDLMKKVDEKKTGVV